MAVSMPRDTSSLQASIHHQKSLCLMAGRRGEALLVPPYVRFLTGCCITVKNVRQYSFAASPPSSNCWNFFSLT